jgi:hypothetical protein
LPARCGDRLLGIEYKRSDAPRLTLSMGKGFEGVAGRGGRHKLEREVGLRIVMQCDAQARGEVGRRA